MHYRKLASEFKPIAEREVNNAVDYALKAQDIRPLTYMGQPSVTFPVCGEFLGFLTVNILKLIQAAAEEKNRRQPNA